MKDSSRETVDIAWEHFTIYANKLWVGRVQDMPYLCISGENPPPEREHVFFIQTNNEDWTNKNIEDLFSPYSNVRIYWVPKPKNSAFVELRNKQVVKKAIEGLKKTGENGKWVISRATDYLSKVEKEYCEKGSGSADGEGSAVLGKRHLPESERKAQLIQE